mmetsp:Transcript_9426/g.25570  ORF Transcript_9426/g.25570 Transcript_9426/m.25570 type:complete len:628 (-) Transcript_9426:2400-4283(-)
MGGHEVIGEGGEVGEGLVVPPPPDGGDSVVVPAPVDALTQRNRRREIRDMKVDQLRAELQRWAGKGYGNSVEDAMANGRVWMQAKLMEIESSLGLCAAVGKRGRIPRRLTDNGLVEVEPHLPLFTAYTESEEPRMKRRHGHADDVGESGEVKGRILLSPPDDDEKYDATLGVGERLDEHGADTERDHHSGGSREVHGEGEADGEAEDEDEDEGEGEREGEGEGEGGREGGGEGEVEREVEEGDAEGRDVEDEIHNSVGVPPSNSRPSKRVMGRPRHPLADRLRRKIAKLEKELAIERQKRCGDADYYLTAYKRIVAKDVEGLSLLSSADSRCAAFQRGRRNAERVLNQTSVRTGMTWSMVMYNADDRKMWVNGAGPIYDYIIQPETTDGLAAMAARHKMSEQLGVGDMPSLVQVEGEVDDALEPPPTAGGGMIGDARSIGHDGSEGAHVEGGRQGAKDHSLSASHSHQDSHEHAPLPHAQSLRLPQHDANGSHSSNHPSGQAYAHSHSQAAVHESHEGGEGHGHRHEHEHSDDHEERERKDDEGCQHTLSMIEIEGSAVQREGSDDDEEEVRGRRMMSGDADEHEDELDGFGLLRGGSSGKDGTGRGQAARDGIDSEDEVVFKTMPF